MAKRESERDRLLKDMKDAGNQPTGFKGWMKNVFMYHYLKPTIFALIAALIIGIFVYDMTKDKSYDFVLTIASLEYATQDGKDAAYDILAVTPGDSNRNGKLDIDIQDYAVTNVSGDTDAAYVIQRLQTSFYADPSAVLYIFHEDLREYFEPAKSYRLLSELGIESDDPYFVSAAGCDIIAKMFPYSNPENYYFAFKTCEYSKRDDPKYVAYYDNAVAAYYALTAQN